MNAVRDLLIEIERVQCLVCLAASPPDASIATEDLLESLRLTPAEFGTVIDGLQRDGLVRLLLDGAHPLPRAVRLTEQGRHAIRRWETSVNGDGGRSER